MINFRCFRRALSALPLLFVALLCLSGLAARAQDAYSPPSGYYANAEGKTGTALRNSLRTIIGGHTIISYSNDTAALRVLDENATNTSQVDLIYGPNTDAKVGSWNKEHLWPQSRGLNTGGDSGADYSDLFNLRPANSSVNSARGNKYYDTSTPSDSGYKMPATNGAGADTSTDSDSWEPPVSERGDIARSLFYMDVRYDGTDSNTTDLVLIDTAPPASSPFPPQMARLSTLLKWNSQDPVDEAERKRNSLVYTKYQRNRNPFIDHPEWVSLIFGTTTVPAGTPTPAVNPTATPIPGATATPTPTAAPATAIAPLPFNQNWTNTSLITKDDDWSNVSGIVGYRGDGLTTSTDPRTVTGTSAVVDVNANQTDPNTYATGGVTEFEIANPTIALSGSGTADAPYIALRVNTEGYSNVVVAYTLRDLDGSIDDAVQPIAVQYRIGSTGNWLNLANGTQTSDGVTTSGTYVPDATTGPSLATKTTRVVGYLPSSANNQVEVQLRIITTNASGNDERVGIDDISVNGDVAPNLSPSGAIISEFRQRGSSTTAPATDEYVELFNTTGEAINVEGWQLQYKSGGANVTATLPTGAIIPAFGHYLIVGAGYSLANYGGTGAAAGDFTLASAIDDGSNLTLLAGEGTTQDTVAFGGGTLTFAPTQTGQYAFVRQINPATNLPVSTANAFNFVAPDAGNYTATTGSLAATLGVPGPESSISPIPMVAMGVNLLDPAVAQATAPNRFRNTGATGTNATNGTLAIRRVIINNTGAPITRLRFRVTTLTTLNGPGYTNAAQADLRAVASPFTTQNITLSNGTTVTVYGTTPDTTIPQSLGGGLNSSGVETSSGVVTLSAPLAAGQSRAYDFTFGVVRTGTFTIAIQFEELNGSTSSTTGKVGVKPSINIASSPVLLMR